MSKRRLILGSVMYLMLLPCSILVLTACVSTPNEIRDPFEKVIGARLDPLVQLVTNRDQYSDDKPVVYQVVNRKTVPVYFPDYSYGIQAYVYDQQSQKWKLFPWKFGLNDPKPAVVAPGTGRGTENTYVIDMVSMPPSGKVRLVVVGWLDPTNPEGSKIAAFTDIEIVRQRIERTQAVPYLHDEYLGPTAEMSGTISNWQTGQAFGAVRMAIGTLPTHKTLTGQKIKD